MLVGLSFPLGVGEEPFPLVVLYPPGSMVVFAFALLHRLMRVAVGFGLGRLLVVWEDLVCVIVIDDGGFDGDFGVKGVIRLLCG